MDSSGNVWVADTKNSRVEEFSSKGEFIRKFGAFGSGNGQFKNPDGIAVDPEGHVWVLDESNARVQEFSATGEYITQWGTYGPGEHQFENPYGIAVDPEGHVWITDTENEHVEEFSSKGTLIRKFGTEGTGDGQFKGPLGIAVDSKKHVWVVDLNNFRVEEFTSEGMYLGQFGEEGIGNGQFFIPSSVAVDAEDHVWVTDLGDDRVQGFSSEGKYLMQFGTFGTGNGQFESPTGIAVDSSGHLWVADTGNNRIQEFTIPTVSENEPPPEPPNPGTSALTTIEYRVPTSGTGAPEAMGAKEVEGWGQTDDPVEATAVFPPDEPMGWPAKDYRRASILYLDSKGRTVNTVSPGGGISTTEYNTTDDVVRTLKSDNRQAALKEGSKSAEVSKLLDTENTYNGEGTELQSTLGPQHAVKLASGAEVQARDHEQYSYDEGAPTEGGPYDLVTKLTNGAQYSGKEEEVRTTTTAYAGQENLGWKLREPTSVTTDPSGLKLVHTTLYEAATGDVTETRMPASTGSTSAHDEQTIYYTTAANAKYPGCGEHAEWAGLPCQTQPAKQPETSGIPNLPVTTATYNVWDEPEKTTEAVGSTTRTKTATYDAAGRLKTSAIASTVGTALPTVTDEYNTSTGAREKQTTEGKKTIKGVENTLGEMTSYTDADENTSTYTYDIDGRAEKINDGKGTQTYTYDSTTGDLTKLVDSAAGTFTGAYDIEGNLLTAGYPNGMNASYTYNATGGPTHLEYVKTTHCTEKCTWFSDSVSPSIHGQWLSQTSTLSSQSYTYDAAGRLTQVQNTPAGKGCTTRVYAYEADTNRTSLTTREPGAKGECPTTGGAVEKHTYDEADRLHDTGAGYSTFGNITALPAADAGGSELTSAYYVDNQLQSQTQNGETIGYNLDPGGRTRETVSTGKTSKDVIDHFAGDGDSPAWTIETPSGNWTRDIQGIGGGLAAIELNGAAPVLQLTDLHGDIIATAALSETETKLLSTQDTSEYGVPTTTTPPKYSWLGADELSTELPSGVVAMGARSYVPQLGRFLQTDPVAGGSANAYAYVFGDPVGESDPSGEFATWFKEFHSRHTAEVVEAAAAREKAAEEEASRKAMEAIEAASRAAAASQAGGPEEPLGGSEGWAAEYAAETGQEEEGGGSYGGDGGGDDMHFITDKGGPGATCGSNSTNHRKCHEPRPSKRGEGQEWCEFVGGAIGGIFGSPGGLGGSTVGAAAGTVAGKEACKE